MIHECKITVLETKVFPEYQKKYLANPNSGPCPFFIERIDIPETEEERVWLEKQDFTNSAEDAYTG